MPVATHRWPGPRRARSSVWRWIPLSQYEFPSHHRFFHRSAERRLRLGGHRGRLDARPTMGHDQTAGRGPEGLLTGLTSAHVVGRPLVVDGIGGLTQDEVETDPELGQRPTGTTVGRVAQGSTGAVDADRQRLDTMIGPVEGQVEGPDTGRSAVADPTPVEDR